MHTRANERKRQRRTKVGVCTYAKRLVMLATMMLEAEIVTILLFAGAAKYREYGGFSWLSEKVHYG